MAQYKRLVLKAQSCRACQVTRDSAKASATTQRGPLGEKAKGVEAIEPARGVYSKEARETRYSGSTGKTAKKRRMGTTWGRFSVKVTRKDLLVRKPTGVVAEEDDPEQDDEALKTLMAETHTVASKRSTWARLRWWSSKAQARRMAPYPLSVEKLQLAAAILKKG